MYGSTPSYTFVSLIERLGFWNSNGLSWPLKHKNYFGMPHNRGVGPLEYYRCKLSMSQGLSSRPGRLKVTWMPTLCLRLWLREQLQCLVVHVHISNKGETPILHPTTRLPKAASDKRWVYGESIWRLRDYSRKCLSFLEKWVFMCFAWNQFPFTSKLTD